MAACEALSFAGLRLVIVEGADALEGARRGAPGRPTWARPTRAPAWRWWPPGPLAPKLHAAVGRARAGSCATGPTPRPSGRRAGAVARRALRVGGEAPGGAVPRRWRGRVVERVMVDRPDARRGGITAMELTREAEKLSAYADGEPISGRDGGGARAAPPRRPRLRAGRRAGGRRRGARLRRAAGPRDGRRAAAADRRPGAARQPLPLAWPRRRRWGPTSRPTR